MNAPEVSIIIPTFNRAVLLPRAIRSVMTQTFTDWEIIIVDDGSTDDTGSVLSGFASRLGAKLVVIHQTNAGSSAARNRGIDAARGRFVAFLDSDDEFRPNKLARQLQLFKQCPEIGLVYSDYSYVNLEGHRHDSVFATISPRARSVACRSVAPGLYECGQGFFDELIQEYFVATITGMVRREALSDSARTCSSDPSPKRERGGCQPRCSTQVESARAKMLEKCIAVADREPRGSFPSLVSPVRRLLGGFVYSNEGCQPVACPSLARALGSDSGRTFAHGHTGDDIRFPVGLSYAEEWLFFLQLARRTRVGFVDEPLCVHHWLRGSLSRTDVKRNLLGMAELLTQLPWRIPHLNRRQRRVVRHNLAHTTLQLAYEFHREGRLKEASAWFWRSLVSVPRLCTAKGAGLCVVERLVQGSERQPSV